VDLHTPDLDGESESGDRRPALGTDADAGAGTGADAEESADDNDRRAVDTGRNGRLGSGRVGFDRVRRQFFRTVVLCTLVFFYGPILAVGYLSLAPNGQPSVPIEGVSLRWYVAVLTDARFVESALTSIGIGVVVAIGGTALGAMAAHVIVRGRLDRWVRGLIGLIVALPLFVPTVVLALGIGVFAGRVGLGFGLVPVLLGHLFWVLPFSTFLLTARYATLDAELSEAARDLGASNAEVARTVVIPLLAPALLASVLFCFALSFNEFLVTFFLAGSAITTMPLELFGQIRIGATTFLNAASVLVLVVSGALATLASRFEAPV
jgi:spermidine/putrescine transport system permease protein